MTERGIELIKMFEGFSSIIYLCPSGYPTIGYGHVVTPEERERFRNGITKDKAEELLKSDLRKFERLIKHSLKAVKLHEYCFDALISFAYNVGFYAFRASTLRRKIINNELLSAGDEFLRWVFAGGRKLKGLVVRRSLERDLFLTGVSCYMKS